MNNKSSKEVFVKNLPVSCHFLVSSFDFTGACRARYTQNFIWVFIGCQRVQKQWKIKKNQSKYEDHLEAKDGRHLSWHKTAKNGEKEAHARFWSRVLLQDGRKVWVKPLTR